MPHTHYHPRRIVLIRAAMETQAAITRTAVERGFSYGEAVAHMAIRLGDLQGRPMSVSDVAATTGQKFATSHRYIQALKKRLLVEGVQDGQRVIYRLTPRPEEAVVTKLYAEIDKIARIACRKLRTIDAETLRRPKN